MVKEKKKESKQEHYDGDMLSLVNDHVETPFKLYVYGGFHKAAIHKSLVRLEKKGLVKLEWKGREITKATPTKKGKRQAVIFDP